MTSTPTPNRIVTRPLRLAIAALLLLLTLTALMAAAFVAANWRDEPLLPEVAALPHFAAPDAEAMQRNGYFVMLGLDAPAEENARATGVRRFQEATVAYRAYLQTGDWPDDVDKVGEVEPISETINVLGDRALRCGAEQFDCLRHYQSHSEAAKQALLRFGLLLERYRAIDTLPVYEEVILPDPSFPFPPYAGVVTASELTGVEAALLLQSGQTHRALKVLIDNRQRLQRMWDGSRTLIGMMIANAAIYRQQRLVADILHHHPEIARDDAALARAAAGEIPLSAFAAMEGEMRFALGMHATLRQADLTAPQDASAFSKSAAIFKRTFFRWIFLPNETANLVHQRWRFILDLANTPANAWESSLQRWEMREREHAPWGSNPPETSAQPSGPRRDIRHAAEKLSGLPPTYARRRRPPPLGAFATGRPSAKHQTRAATRLAGPVTARTAQPVYRRGDGLGRTAQSTGV